MLGRRLRVLTLNCLFHSRQRDRLQVIERLLDETGADVACLQEIVLVRNARLLRSRPAVFHAWGPLVYGGLVTVTAATVEDSSFETYRTGLWFEWAARKGLLTTRLRWHDTQVTVINTHLLANYDEDWSLDNGYARRQLDELSQLAEAVRQVTDDHLLVVAGDFNVPLASPQFADFMACCRLVPAFDWHAAATPERASLPIDNVLVRAPGGAAVEARAEICLSDRVQLRDGRSVYPSDHVAVLGEIRW